MRILCYGDSNTWGHNPSDGSRFENRWTAVLRQCLGEAHEVIEEGLCGRCASFVDSVKPYRHALSSIRMVLETHQPIDAIIIMLGTNDLKANFSPNAVAISNGIKEMIHIIKDQYIYNEHSKIPDIYIVSPIEVREGYKDIPRVYEQFGEYAIENSKKLATYYQDVCKANDCNFLDASLYAQASTNDCVHMDEENHIKLARAMYQMLVKSE